MCEYGSCYHQIFKQSKFYLALENSNCQDYVSEKFWFCFQKGVIPIVSGNNGYEKVAPPHSYINIQDFGTVEELAEYILLLDRDTELHSRYFWWKYYYKLVDS